MAAMASCIIILSWLLLFRECASFEPAVIRPKSTSSVVYSCTRLASSKEDPNDLIEKARSLRKDVESFEAAKQATADEIRMREEAVLAERQQAKERYSAMVPILKPDGSTQDERCDFVPRWKEGSEILVLEASLPIGAILGESDEFGGTIAVDEVGEGTNGESAGLKVGDLVRAFTACKVEMEMPTWQLIAGGIGVPKTKRFMYSVDGRPFEEVMDAVASNRQDPEERPVLFVVERKDKSSKNYKV